MIRISVFEQLKSDEFTIRMIFPATASGLRELLLSAPEVRRLWRQLREGFITENMIRAFVTSLMQEFRAGVSFPHQVALSAIAAVLERHYTPFADELLIDLARVRCAEMTTAASVARECLARRVRRPRRRRVFVVAPTESHYAASATFTTKQRSSQTVKSRRISDYAQA